MKKALYICLLLLIFVITGPDALASSRDMQDDCDIKLHDDNFHTIPPVRSFLPSSNDLTRIGADDQESRRSAAMAWMFLWLCDNCAPKSVKSCFESAMNLMFFGSYRHTGKVFLSGLTMTAGAFYLNAQTDRHMMEYPCPGELRDRGYGPTCPYVCTVGPCDSSGALFTIGIPTIFLGLAFLLARDCSPYSKS